MLPQSGAALCGFRGRNGKPAGQRPSRPASCLGCTKFRSKAILANLPVSPGCRTLAKSTETSEASPSSVIYVAAVVVAYRSQGGSAMRNLIDDFRFGLRILLRNPGFTLAACLVLALGIGANTAIFSVVNAVLLRPLPYQDAPRIMQVWHIPPAKSFPGMTLFSVSPANYLDWQAQNHSFEQMAAYGFASFNVGGERPEAIRGSSVAPGFFSILRVQPVLGRIFSLDDKGWGATLLPLREQLVGDVRPALLVLLGAVAFVLLIACANVANLVLAKTLARKKEIAIRTSLGASRAAVLRQILAETLILSISGAAFGLFLARFGITLMEKFLADQLPSSVEITLDAQVLTFTLFLALFAGILAGLLPAVRFTKTDIYEALRQGQSRGSSDSSGNKTRSLLVVSEVALSLVLLIGAGLMLRTLLQLSSVRPGFNPNTVLTAALPVPGTKFSTPAAESRFCVQLLEQLRATPGVLSAALIDSLPLDGGGSHQPIAVEGQPIVPMADQPEIDVRVISPGYLSTMRIPLLRGRDLNDADIVGRPPVVLISESVAKRFWPNDNPIGKHVTLTFSGKAAREVVGVVGDVKEDSLGQTRPTEALYWPLSQMTAQPGETWRAFGMSLAVRTSADPASATSAVSAAVHRVDPELPVVHVVTMEGLISASLSSQRFNVLLLGAFAGLALVLAAVGIYGVLSYTVRRRVREIGIRMALGASHSDVLRLVVADGMKPILLGVALGLAAALALSRVVASLIFGVRATDPLTFAAVALLLVAVGLLATVLPAYRATRVEPVSILREE